MTTWANGESPDLDFFNRMEGIYDTSTYCYLTRSALLNSGNLVLWDNEVNDDNNMHDNSTNPERITVPNTGYYQVDVILNVTNTGATAGGNFQLRKNGTVVTLVRESLIGSDYTGVNLNMTMKLTATDYIDIYFQSAFSASLNLAISSYSQITVKQIW